MCVLKIVETMLIHVLVDASIFVQQMALLIEVFAPMDSIGTTKKSKYSILLIFKKIGILLWPTKVINSWLFTEVDVATVTTSISVKSQEITT